MYKRQVDGLVYDITPHISHHPGWTSGSVTTVVAIMTYLGKDATLAFHAIGVHASPKVKAELRAYRIGILVGSTADTSGGEGTERATGPRESPSEGAYAFAGAHLWKGAEAVGLPWLRTAGSSALLTFLWGALAATLCTVGHKAESP